MPKDPHPIAVLWHLARHRLRKKSLEQRYEQATRRIRGLRADLTGWSDPKLRAYLEASRLKAAHLALQGDCDDFEWTVAALCETAKRVLGQDPYDVQVRAALGMLDGYLMQVAPGEGKTLTLALVAAIRGWEPGPCHLITANEYLAARDADALRPFYTFCGLEAVAIDSAMTPSEKAEAYAKPLVYATAKQVVADHLIDRLRFGGAINRVEVSLRSLKGQSAVSLMQRGLGDALVDEVDQILVDEAITPMIISEPEDNPLLHEAILAARQWVDRLEAGVDYQIVPGEREVIWLDAGLGRLAEFAPKLPAMWRARARLEDLFTQAVLARDRFVQDHHYVVLDDQVVIVDEATGRSMPGRSWSYGLHQAIEARAGVPLTAPSRTLTRLSFQNFFKLYRRLAGASGTLQAVDRELYFNYRVFTLAVPPRLPLKRRMVPLKLARNAQDRDAGVVEAVRTRVATGQPVLIGTRSVSSSETLAHALKAIGIECQILNAKQPATEADIVASAGRLGCVTVATNMAGRGTDIKLSDESLARGGLCVVMVEPHESVRVDWQLYGRAGRQGEPGEVIPWASLGDELFTRHIPQWCRLLCLWAPQWAVSVAQWRAQSRAFALRKRINQATKESRERMTFSAVE